MPQAEIHHLAAQQVLRWPHRMQTVRLQVLTGRLWVTQSGDSADYFLGPGDVAEFSGPRVVAEAMTDVQWQLGGQPGIQQQRPTHTPQANAALRRSLGHV